MTGTRVGLALGSGAARGWAHLGVIRALEQAGIEVEVIVGTSMGAFVGAAYAAGQLERLEEVALGMQWRTVLGLLDIRLRHAGLIDGVRVESFVREHVRSIRFDELHIPFAAVATDIFEAERVVLDRGDLIRAVRASISLPGIFTPVEHEGRLLMDGGLVDPVPVSVARAMGADRVIAVDLNHSLRLKARARARRSAPSRQPAARDSAASAWLTRLRASLNEHAARVHPILAQEVGGHRARKRGPSIFEILITTIAVMEVQIAENRLALDPPDLVIRPNLADFNLVEFHRAGEAIEAGYEAAREALTGWG